MVDWMKKYFSTPEGKAEVEAAAAVEAETTSGRGVEDPIAAEPPLPVVVPVAEVENEGAAALAAFRDHNDSIVEVLAHGLRVQRLGDCYCETCVTVRPEIVEVLS